MSCRGVHFALTTAQEQRLLAAFDDDSVMEVIEELDQAWDKPHLVETDKAWDAIHRCLTDGTLDAVGDGYPLSHAVLGGEQLHRGEDYIISYVSAEQVRDIAAALQPIDEDWLRERYFALEDYDGPQDEEDFDYTWSNLVSLRNFFSHASSEGRAVIFAVDQ